MQVPNITLNDNNHIPQVGFGTWRITDEQAAQSIQEATKAGYRHIDTAGFYGNEAGIGQGIKDCNIDRKELFVTTKLWNEDQGYDNTLKAFEESRKKLGLEYLDLYLIHWPCPQQGLYLESWKAMIELQKQGLIKSIGVSNFRQQDIEHIINETGVKPTVNQIELHPYFQQKELSAFNKEHNIETVGYMPLGRGAAFQEPILEKLATKYNKSIGQVVLRWHIDLGNIIIPKTQTPSRMVENLDIFDFQLSSEDMAEIAKLDDKDGRVCGDPATFYKK